MASPTRKLGEVLPFGCAMSSPADDSATYPVLSDDELATLRRYGTVRHSGRRKMRAIVSDVCWVRCTSVCDRR